MPSLNLEEGGDGQLFYSRAHVRAAVSTCRVRVSIGQALQGLIRDRRLRSILNLPGNFWAGAGIACTTIIGDPHHCGSVNRSKRF